MNNQSHKTTYMFVFRGPGMANRSPAEMEASFQKWMAWIESLKAKGQYIAGDPLEDTPAKVLRGPGAATKVTDGPYVEAKEIVGGYMLIHAKAFDEAVTIAQDCPGLERGSVEVRELMPIPS